MVERSRWFSYLLPTNERQARPHHRQRELLLLLILGKLPDGVCVCVCIDNSFSFDWLWSPLPLASRDPLGGISLIGAHYPDYQLVARLAEDWLLSSLKRPSDVRTPGADPAGSSGRPCTPPICRGGGGGDYVSFGCHRQFPSATARLDVK